MFSLDQVIVWIVVGLIGGALAGALMTWERGGYGLWRNLALGLAGAVIGGCCSACSGYGRASTKSPSRCATLFPPLLARYSCLRHLGVAQVRSVTEKRVISVGGPSSLVMTWRRPPTLNAPRVNRYDIAF